MKTLSKFFSIVIIGAFFLQACNFNYKKGNGNIETEAIDLKNFDKISIGGNYDVTLIQGENTRVVIETDENLLRYINTELFDKTLNINNVHHLKGSKGIKVEIYYNSINKIYSTGASKIVNEGLFVADELMINLSGAGAIELEIETTRVKVNLTGAGVITLSGETDFQETHISGAGGLSAAELISKECSINLSGLGGAQVHAADKLEATITGVGGIIYSGNPNLIERQVTGFGKIKRAEEYIDDEDI